MKAYITSIGEPTTDICREQLTRFGFDVVVLDAKEDWPTKYRRFVEMADGDCLRLDADVIPNKNIAIVRDDAFPVDCLGVSLKCYCLYANDLVDNGVFYSKQAIKAIRRNMNLIDWRRPEASAWRIPELNDRLFFNPLVVGLHGFFQDEAHFVRALQNKTERKQLDRYDFELAYKLTNL